MQVTAKYLQILVNFDLRLIASQNLFQQIRHFGLFLGYGN